MMIMLFVEILSRYFFIDFSAVLPLLSPQGVAAIITFWYQRYYLYWFLRSLIMIMNLAF